VVIVVDTDEALVARLRREGGYTLSVVGPEGRHPVFVPILLAYQIGDDNAELDTAISNATTVTTSVQVGNLGRVVTRLASVWRQAPEQSRTVIGCENLHQVGNHIAHLFDEAGRVPHLACPNCLVDRICATNADGTAIETEDYSEWVIDGAAVVPGPDRVSDVERLFFRKRYLVNTVADACAFVGRIQGAPYLHEAVSDPVVRDTVAPLIDLLCEHLTHTYGFDPSSLEAYLDTSFARLSNPGISRRIDTVARDPWRKFAFNERFLEPVLAVRAEGGDCEAALDVLAKILQAIEPDPEALAMHLADIWSGTSASALTVRLSGTTRVSGGTG
jgi:mannitol-1-phosphate 5-dehydrogenase